MMTLSNWNIFRVIGPLVRGTPRSPINSPHKGQWRGVLISLICTWTNGYVNNLVGHELRRHGAHYDVTFMKETFMPNQDDQYSAWWWTMVRHNVGNPFHIQRNLKYHSLFVNTPYSRRIPRRFCTDLGIHTDVLCANHPKYLFAKTGVIGARDFANYHFKADFSLRRICEISVDDGFALLLRFSIEVHYGLVVYLFQLPRLTKTSWCM